MASSSTVSTGDVATAAQYNNLRTDVLDTSSGHSHTGTDSADLGTLTADLTISQSGASQIEVISTANDAYLILNSDTDEGQDSEVIFESGGTARGRIEYNHHATANTQLMSFFTADNAVETLKLAGNLATFATAVDLGSNTLTSTGSMQIRTIDYSDGDLAMTIADGGGVTFAQDTTFDGDITISADGKNIVIPKGYIQLENDPSAPSAPSAGYVRIYSDTTYDGIAIAHSAGTSFLNHQKLVLGAGLTTDAGILFNGDGTDTYIGFDGGTNDLMIGTGTTIGSNSFMTFSDTYGNIGIGHTPTTGNVGIQYEDDLTGTNNQTIMAHVGIGVGGGHSMNTQNDTIAYSRAGTLDVNRPVLTINGSDTVADAFTLRVANEAQAGTRAWALWVDAGTSRFDGDIGNASYRIPKIWTTNQDTTNAENVSSWSQVKENINTYTEDALAILRKISVVSFSHVTDLDPSGRIKLGLLADSIDEPLAAPMGEYEFGYGIGPRIDMMGLAALAVRSIQELETRLLALEGGK